MDKTETFLTLSPADQRLEEITRLLLEQRDTRGEWALHAREREDEKEMRRLEKDARCGDLYKQMKKLGAEVEGLRQRGDASGPAPDSDVHTMMEAIQQSHQQRMAEIVSFAEAVSSAQKPRQ